MLFLQCPLVMRYLVCSWRARASLYESEPHGDAMARYIGLMTWNNVWWELACENREIQMGIKMAKTKVVF